jgi:hypothetical protein
MNMNAQYGVEYSIAFPEFRVHQCSTGKLVGSCTSDIAAWAIWRLMHVEWLLDSMQTGIPLQEGKQGDPRQSR